MNNNFNNFNMDDLLIDGWYADTVRKSCYLSRINYERIAITVKPVNFQAKSSFKGKVWNKMGFLQNLDVTNSRSVKEVDPLLDVINSETSEILSRRTKKNNPVSRRWCWSVE